jgi:putative CocE/NonD family hydrolase
VVMRDGVELAIDVYRPGWGDVHPAIIEHIPYRKDDVTGPDRWSLYKALARRGLGVVRVDVRGTGSSGGVAADEYTEDEQEDGVEMTAWAASQPWCNGAVGAWGMSYGGFTAVQLATHQPPALKAIAAFYATDDRYTDDMHFYGGALCALELGHYPIRMIAMNALPPGGALDDDTREQWRRRIDETPPWILRWLEEQHDGPYWRNGSLRPDPARIRVPVLLVGGWRDGYCNSAVRMAADLEVPVEAVVGPWSHVLPDRAPVGPRINVVDLLASWFGRHLRGDARSAPADAPVRIFVQGFDDPTRTPGRISGTWKGFDRWPDPADTWVLHPSPDGRLAPTPSGAAVERTLPSAPHAGIQTGNWCPPPPPDGLPGDQRPDEAFAITFETDPLPNARTCIGFPQITLKVGHPGPTATIAVKLADVSPSGASQLVTRGVLNLSHTEGHLAPAPFDGDATSTTIELNATAWRFDERHRVRLAVAAADWPTTWPAPTPISPTVTVDATARLELPLVENGTPLHDEVSVDQPTDDVSRDGLLPAAWRVVRDGLSKTAGIETAWGETTQDDARSIRTKETLAVTALVSEADPLAAAVEAEGAFELSRPDVDVRTHARGRFTGTAEAFVVELTLDVTADGETFASRRWHRRIPRQLV